MKVGKLKEILANVDDSAEVMIGVWLEECRDAPAVVGVDSVDVTHFVEEQRVMEVCIVTKP